LAGRAATWPRNPATDCSPYAAASPPPARSPAAWRAAAVSLRRSRAAEVRAAAGRHCSCAGPPQDVVCGEQPRRLVAPLELRFHPPAAGGSHGGAARGIVDELDDLRGEVRGVVAARIERGVLRRPTALRE